MRFDFPQALLLLVPLGLLLWRTARLPGPAMWLRVALILVIVTALARPQVVLRSDGSDLVVLVDRSRSMPPGADGRAEELIRLAEAERRSADRLGVVSFAQQPKVEVAPSAGARFVGFTQSVEPHASDIGAALDRAYDLIPQERTGRVLIVSDGRSTGGDPRGAARRLAARGIAVDYRHLAREDHGLDLAVTSVDVPSSVAVREPFQLTATVHASTAAEGTVTLTRNGQPLVRGPYSFREGPNLLTFRDLIPDAGVAQYRLHVEAQDDAVVENDVGFGVLRVEGPPRVLLMSSVGEQGVLAQTLREVGVDVDVRPPSPLSMADLEGVGALVLEDVEAGALSEPGLRVISQYVKEAGGGLVMTGGRKSFGEGGYRRSPIEDLLPVSLEMRQEQRKASIALSIVMDSSCSMGVTVPDGRTKMALAGEGAVAALQLLNEDDEASVWVVDTAPHEIFPMSPVKRGLPISKVAGAFSGGGGIMVGIALRKARDEILESNKATRHILLFADAADAEAPEDYRAVLAELRAKNVSVSVIGMGTPSDPDAALLVEVAQLGGGRMYFAEDPQSLPRIFSQETIAVARATFVDSPSAVKAGPDLPLLGKLPTSGLPQVGGYNLTYLKPQASVAWRSADDNEAPIIALWPKGTGRVVAFTAQADGTYTGPLREWGSYRSLLEQVVRWTMPGHAPDAEAPVARATRRGNDLHITLDFDPRHAPAELNPTVLILSGDGRALPVELPLRFEGEDRLGAHFTLPGPGTWHPVVRVAGQVLRAPPVALPYAPEFEPGTAAEGRALLAQLASLTGGAERLSMSGLFSDLQESEATVALAPFLICAALLLLLAEVFTRRFFAGRPQRVVALTDAALRSVLAPQTAEAKAKPSRAATAPRRWFGGRASGAPFENGGAVTATSDTASTPEQTPTTTNPAEAAPGPRAGAAPPSMQSALDQARERAGRRLKR